MNRTGLKEQADKQPTLVMALADHICGAIQRAQRKQNIEYRSKRKYVPYTPTNTPKAWRWSTR